MHEKKKQKFFLLFLGNSFNGSGQGVGVKDTEKEKWFARKVSNNLKRTSLSSLVWGFSLLAFPLRLWANVAGQGSCFPLNVFSFLTAYSFSYSFFFVFFDFLLFLLLLSTFYSGTSGFNSQSNVAIASFHFPGPNSGWQRHLLPGDLISFLSPFLSLSLSLIAFHLVLQQSQYFSISPLESIIIYVHSFSCCQSNCANCAYD